MLSSSLIAALAWATVASAGATGINSTLSRSFYGMAYSPVGVILPDCGAEQSDVTADIIAIAQLSPRIRLYGADCNQTALVLQAIQDAGDVDLTVWPAIYIGSPLNQTVIDRQVDSVVEAFKTYGTKHIGGLIVGNEFLLLSYGDDGSPTDSAGTAARTQLLEAIQTINSTITGESFDTHIPIGTADAGSACTLELCEGIDFYMANVHPWFGSVAASGAAAWTWDFFQEFDVDVCKEASNNPVMYIAETGWPTESMDTANAVNGANSPASVANLQVFLDDFICEANTNGTNYFMFEFRDEKWKETYGGVEPYWGLTDSDRNFKAGLTMPSCTVDSPTGGSAPTSLPDSVATSSGSSATSGSSSGSNSDDSASSLSLSWGALGVVALAALSGAAVLAF